MSSKNDQGNRLSYRLKELRRILDMSQTEMARSVGKSQQTWGAYETGSSTPPVDVIQFLLVEYDIDANWLIKGQDESFATVAEGKKGVRYTMDNEKSVSIPLLSYLGDGKDWAEEEVNALILAGESLFDWMRRKVDIAPSQAFVVEVRGKGMETWAYHSDLVIGERMDSIAQDEIYAVVYKGDLLVRHCLRRGDTVTLRSENTRYDDIVTERDEDLRVIGRIARRIIA